MSSKVSDSVSEAFKYGFVEEGRVCGCTSLLGQELVIKMYYDGKRVSRGPL